MSIARTIPRWAAAVTFVAAGLNHFWKPATYLKIMPPALPRPGLLVAVSGVAEIAGGIGLLVPPLRRPAGWGLIALLIAVFPANVHMLTSHDPAATLGVPRWALWVRLPVQGLLIAWAEWVSRP